MEALGHSPRPAGSRCRLRLGELASELQREERVPARRLLQSRQLRSRQLQIEPPSEQVVQRAQAERSNPEPLQPLFGERLLELERRREAGHLPQRHQRGDRLVAQAAEGDLEHGRRGRVEPLDIVERDDHRTVLCERAQDVEQSDSDQARIRRSLAGLGEQECHLERAQSHRSQRRRYLAEHIGEQVGETGIGERSLGLDAPAGEHVLEASPEPARLPPPRGASCRSQPRPTAPAQRDRHPPYRGTPRSRRAPPPGL